MIITPVKTRVLQAPQDDLYEALRAALPEVPERSILVISSKVVSIHQGRCVPVDGADKSALAMADCDEYLEKGEEGRMHTITYGTLTGSAGIDESNGNGYYVLWPHRPDDAAAHLWSWVRAQYQVQEVGVIIADSHSMPLHNGATGFALACFGFQPLKDYRGSQDLFGRALRFERQNVADGLAAAANVVMGEADECVPLAVITDVPRLVFTESLTDDPYLSLRIPRDQDIFRTFLRKVPWKQGGEGVRNA